MLNGRYPKYLMINFTAKHMSYTDIHTEMNENENKNEIMKEESS